MLTIEKRLQLRGAADVNAVMLNDTGERYPVLLESLHNTVLFPELMNSGYKLEGLPYKFIKDGVRFEQLPIEPYNQTPEEEERMYNSIGVKLSQEELQKHVTFSEIQGIETPPTSYSIFTREEFLEYLDNLKKFEIDNDYMPINYFVHPSALFSIDEYLSDAYKPYVEIMNNRRLLSLHKFTALVNTLLTINLKPNYTDQDVLDAYFAWGFDGLREDVIKVDHTESPMILSARRMENMNAKAAPMISATTYGFVDSFGNRFIADKDKNRNWELSSDYITNSSLAEPFTDPNELHVAAFKASSTQVRTILHMRDHFDIVYNSTNVTMLMHEFNPIRVKSPISEGAYVPLYMALPNNRQMLIDDAIMQSLVKAVHKYRKPKVNITSFDALHASGCSSNAAIEYISDSLGVTRKSENYGPGSGGSVQTSDLDLPKLDLDAIEDYLSGKLVKELKEHPTESLDNAYEFFMGIMSGDMSIDRIAEGRARDNQINQDYYMYSFKAVHDVLGISIQDIYNKVKSIQSGAKYLEFSNNGMTFKMDVSPLKAASMGYVADVQMYDSIRARDCDTFIYVTQIAKEVGDEERADRHVGIEFYSVDKNAEVKRQLDALVQEFLERVQQMPAGDLKERFMYMANNFALARYFEMALKGTKTWPAQLGGSVETVSDDVRNSMMKHVNLYIESLPALLQFSVNRTTNTLNLYCTNAVLSEYYVVPRSDRSPIHEVPFYALWYDYRQFPELWAKLVGVGAVKPDFVPWSVRPDSAYFIRRNFMDYDEVGTLLNYYNRAVSDVQNWPKSKDFIHVMHPMEEMFPGLYELPDEYSDMFDDLPAPRADKPAINVYTCRELTNTMMRKYLEPTRTEQEKESYIRGYSGLNADILINVPDALDKIPHTFTGNHINVYPSHELIYCKDFASSGPVHFSNIVSLDKEKYGIVNIYDRFYLFKGADGRLWEARI